MKQKKEVKDKVVRTHCVTIDTCRDALQRSEWNCYACCSISDENNVDWICPKCSNVVRTISEGEAIYANRTGNVIENYCDKCDITYNGESYKFISKKEEDGYTLRKYQWVDKVEVFLSNDTKLHIRPHIITSYARFVEKSNKYVVTRRTHIFNMAFNLKTGLSYLTGVVDGNGKSYSIVMDHFFANFKRDGGFFARTLSTQADSISAIKDIFPNVLEVVENIVKQTSYQSKLDVLSKAKIFTDLVLWNRLKNVDGYSRLDFYNEMIGFPRGYSNEKIDFARSKLSYVSNLILKDKRGTLEQYVDNVSARTKSGKALKKLFYKNPLLVQYNRQLYLAGMKDANIRQTLFNTLEKLSLLSMYKPHLMRSNVTNNKPIDVYYTFDNFITFFINISKYVEQKKMKSLIRQIVDIVQTIEFLYQMESGNLGFSNGQLKFNKGASEIDVDHFVIGNFNINSYSRTPVGKKLEEFRETISVYERVLIGIEELQEINKENYNIDELVQAVKECFYGKNFYEIHQNLSNLASTINNLKQDIPIEYSEDDLRFEGVFEGYEFSLPKKLLDFNKLGAEFYNCVSSYANAVADKRALIVVARDLKTKKPKLCIELSGEKGALTSGSIRCSLQYKSLYNRAPLEDDIKPLKAWYEYHEINNSICRDAYWLIDESKQEQRTLPVAQDVVRVARPANMDMDDFEMPF